MNEIINIVLLGDIHGSFSQLTRRIREYHKDSYIIQVGDFGLFQEYKEEKCVMELLNTTLQENNCQLYAFRGNHDNPERFSSRNHPYGYKNITVFPDYSELELFDKKILMVGGGISLDRIYRTQGKNYWKDENFIFQENFPYKEYDLVLTHIRPSYCPFRSGFAQIQHYIDHDEFLFKDLVDENSNANKLYDALPVKPKDWVFGHFHNPYLGRYENTNFRCLAINEEYLYHSTKPPFQ